MNFKLKIVLYRLPEGRVVFRPFGYNKFVLLLFGAILNGAAGAVLGFIIGCTLDTNYIKNDDRASRSIDWRMSFLMLGAFIVQISGIQSDIAFAALKNKLNKQFGESYAEKRFLFFNELLRQRIQVESICDQLNRKASIDDKISLISFLYEITSVQKTDYHKLNKTIYYLAARINLDDVFVKTISARYAVATENLNEFAIFDLPADATYIQLKKAYYSLAKKYHPDSNLHLSATEKKKFEEQFRNITEAYEKFKLKKGWS